MGKKKTRFELCRWDWLNREVGCLTSDLWPLTPGFYMYIETSRPRLEGDKARLLTPTFNVGSKGTYGTVTANPTYCFAFYYHMYGKHIGKRRLHVRAPPCVGLHYCLNNEPRWNKIFNYSVKNSREQIMTCLGLRPQRFGHGIWFISLDLGLDLWPDLWLDVWLDLCPELGLGLDCSWIVTWLVIWLKTWHGTWLVTWFVTWLELDLRLQTLPMTRLGTWLMTCDLTCDLI